MPQPRADGVEFCGHSMQLRAVGLVDNRMMALLAAAAGWPEEVLVAAPAGKISVEWYHAWRADSLGQAAVQ